MIVALPTLKKIHRVAVINYDLISGFACVVLLRFEERCNERQQEGRRFLLYVLQLQHFVSKQLELAFYDVDYDSSLVQDAVASGDFGRQWPLRSLYAYQTPPLH